MRLYECYLNNIQTNERIIFAEKRSDEEFVKAHTRVAKINFTVPSASSSVVSIQCIGPIINSFNWKESKNISLNIYRKLRCKVNTSLNM
jgi:hypothetical protein